MPVPSSIADLSTTPGSNSPLGGESPSLIDDYIRTHASFIKVVSNAGDATASGLLGKANSGANTDITSLGGLTTPLSVAQGGTGAATSNAAADALGAFRKGTILGTVSQSAGVPTGAVIERGSNGNGEYARFADGTQICTRNLDFPGQALSTQVDISGNWAAAFAAAPNQQVTCKTQIGGGGQAMVGQIARNGLYGSPSATDAVLQSFSYQVATTSGSDTVRFFIAGIGRWF